MLAAGEELRVPLPIASLLRDRFLTLLANGGGAPRLVGGRCARRMGGRRQKPGRAS